MSNARRLANAALLPALERRYKSQPHIIKEIQAIYAHLLERAEILETNKTITDINEARTKRT